MRARRGATLGPHLAWRVRLFSGAAILVVVGMYSQLNWLIWGAIGLLGVAFLLRFLPDNAPSIAEDPDDLAEGEGAGESDVPTASE